MKHTLFFMLLSALLWGGGATTLAAARLPYDFEHGGMYYYISNVDEVTLVSGDVKYSGNVSIPDTIVQDGKTYRITAIGDYAFDGCSNLTEITIPETVKEIGEYAFHDCELLITVTIPGSVTTIGNYAFWSCDKLTQVILNTGLQTIGIDAFTTCPRLRSVTIPNSVTTIGSSAFSFCSSLQEVTVGTGVKTIGNSAFSSCSSLKTVRITDIAAWCQIAFDGSASNPLSYSHNFYVDGDVPVTKLDIPAEVTSIGSIAFINCTGLTSVKIPATVTKIGSSAFANCTGLRTADIAAETIGEYAFHECTGLETVTLDETVKNIEYGAFYWCHALSGITIPANATLGEVAFEDCNNMKTLTLNEGIKTIPYSAFSRCSSLTSVSIPNSVTSIGNSAFSQCTALRSVTLGDHVETIGAGAFIGLLYGVPLKSITIPESVKKIGSGAFPVVDSICITNLKAWCEIEFEDTNPLANGHLYWNGQLVTSLTIPAGITEIKNYAFSGWKDLKSLVIPAGVTRIGKEAFADCSSLKSLQMGEDVEFIGEKAFYNCANLQSLTMPDAVTEVGRYAFSGCTELKTVKISENLETINDQTFYGCASIDSIKIPDNTRSIGGSAFSKCSSLKSVKLGKGLRTIGGEWAFNECTSLASITIPDNVTTIGNFTFSECTNLKSVKIGNGIEVTNRGLFRECKKLKSVEMGSNLTEISGDAFSHCISLDSITLPASVTKIGSSAFANCDSLTTITGPRVISIESSAFSECKSLTSVKMDRIEDIGYKAFEGCTSLASITLPKSITKIDGRVFQNCTGLTSVKVYNPKPVTLSYDPFSGVDCANDTLYVPAGSIAAYQAAEVWNTFGTILSISDPVSKNFTPTTVSPADSTKVTELAKFTLVFDEKPFLVDTTAILRNEADSSACFPAGIVASSDSTLTITLTDTVVTELGDYLLTIPAGTYGDEIYANDQTTGHCNPELTYAYTVVAVPVPDYDYFPTGVTPEDKAEVEALKTITLEFAETPNLAIEAQPITLAGNDTLLTATLSAGEDNTLAITLADTLKAAGTYKLTIPEGTFGDAAFAADPTTGHCNPALTYTYYIVEDTVPDEPVKPELVKDFMPTGITPADSSEVEALKTFTLAFTETPSLVDTTAALLNETGTISYLADLAAGEGNTLVVTLKCDTLKAAGTYTLTIPEGTFGDAAFAADPTTGHCNPALTYTYTIKVPQPVKPELVKDFMPTGITPADSSEVEALKTFTLEFEETPSLAVKAQTITLAGKDTLLTATLSVGSGNTLEITLADTLKVAGEYTLTIPEGAFGDAAFADDPTVGHCNPELVYIYTIKEPEPVEPDEPDEPEQDFEPVTVTPEAGSEEISFTRVTLTFTEAPVLLDNRVMLAKSDSTVLYPALLTLGESNTLEITLRYGELKTEGTYLLNIPAGTVSDASGKHVNPEYTYVYTLTPEAGSVPTPEAEAAGITVYNLQGILMLQTDEAAELRTLPAGDYIVNGKKTVIAEQ